MAKEVKETTLFSSKILLSIITALLTGRNAELRETLYNMTQHHEQVVREYHLTATSQGTKRLIHQQEKSGELPRQRFEFIIQ